MKKLVLVGFAASLGAVSFAVVPDTGPDPLFTFVGQVGGGSATAIASRSVITAKHIGGTTFTLNGVNHFASARIDHPTFDISILNFASDLPGWHSLGNSSAIGATLTMVGYGGTGSVNAAGTGYDVVSGGGIRRASTNFLHAKGLVNNFGPSLISYLNVNGDAVLAGGDSGGGFFINNQLVGVNAFIFSQNTSLPNYGFASLNGGTAYFGSGAINLTEQSIQTWVRANIVPEPASMAALGLGFVALLRRRRK